MGYSVLGPCSVAVVTQCLQSGMHPHFLSAGKHPFWVRLNSRQSNFYVVGLWGGCLDCGCGVALGTGLHLGWMGVYRVKLAVCDLKALLL